MRWLVVPTAVATLVLLGVALLPLLWRVQAVSGTVQDAAGQPLAGATVRVKATGIKTLTDEQGRFTLTGFTPSFRVPVTAWQHGYYVGGTDVGPWEEAVAITLTPYTVDDNEAYQWIPSAITRSPTEEWLIQTRLTLAARLSFNRAFLPLSERLTLGCSDCHGRTINDQWARGAHAAGLSNPLFRTMYNGTDMAGNQSPPTRYRTMGDYGHVPLRPDPGRPYYGPGYRVDFPDRAGNCAHCHLPGAALENPSGVDPNTVTGVTAQGTFCDFCHKIADVSLDPETGLPRENYPGVLSLKMMRPGPERQIFFGPYDDVDVGPDTYLPLQQQSEVCAACHDASFWGVPIYKSFSEWKESPYAKDGITCQACHMKPDGVTTNFAPGRGGLERDPATLATHFFPGAADPELLQNAVAMNATARHNDGRLTVTVTIINDQTGHHVPTDSPLRHLILLVEATDAEGRPLQQIDGPKVPEWGGTGDPRQGYYAGLPGTAYAKVLQELWTEVSPTGAYWNPTRILSDNRIPAMGRDTTTYAFTAPETGEAEVEVTLLFRRAFIALADQKGWPKTDLIMESTSLKVGGSE